MSEHFPRKAKEAVEGHNCLHSERHDVKKISGDSSHIPEKGNTTAGKKQKQKIQSFKRGPDALA